MLCLAEAAHPTATLANIRMRRRGIYSARRRGPSLAEQPASLNGRDRSRRAPPGSLARTGAAEGKSTICQLRNLTTVG